MKLLSPIIRNCFCSRAESNSSLSPPSLFWSRGGFRGRPGGVRRGGGVRGHHLVLPSLRIHKRKLLKFCRKFTKSEQVVQGGGAPPLSEPSILTPLLHPIPPGTVAAAAAAAGKQNHCTKCRCRPSLLLRVKTNQRSRLNGRFRCFCKAGLRQKGRLLRERVPRSIGVRFRPRLTPSASRVASLRKSMGVPSCASQQAFHP